MDEEVGRDRDSSKGLNLQSSTCYPHGKSRYRSMATFGSHNQAEAYRAHIFPSVRLSSFRWKHVDGQQKGTGCVEEWSRPECLQHVDLIC